jgi:protein-S-isoprenylcysteine O-methyltransferase Ste14
MERVSETMKRGRSIFGIGPRLVASGGAGVIAALCILRALGVPEFAIFPDAVRAIAWAWCGVGFVIWALSARMILRDVPRGILMTGGVYRLSRNPMYAAFIVCVFPGLAVATSFWPLVFAGVGMAAVFPVLIKKEEADLETAFGDAYRAYRFKTPRLFLFF